MHFTNEFSLERTFETMGSCLPDNNDVNTNRNNNDELSTSNPHLNNGLKQNEIEDQDHCKMVSVWKRQEDIFNMLMSMNIQWDGNIISEDIWRIVAEYIISKSNHYTKRKVPKYTI